jgi:peptide/nickel transport system permease protein
LPYILRRLISLGISLWLISILTFFIIHVVPGDPAVLILGTEASPTMLGQMRASLGLDRPLPEQYLTWLAGALRGDLGQSLRHRLPVSQLLVERLPVTISLATLAMLLAVVIAIPWGIVAAVKERSGFDFATLILSQVGVALPAFWIGVLLMLFLAVQIRLFPTSGFVPWNKDPLMALRSLTLPAIALGLPQIAVLVRLVRGSMLDELSKNHITTARAKGLPERIVIVRHALKGALIPTVTMIGLQVGFLLGGSIIIEQVFALPGLGQLVVFAIYNRDIPLVQGLTMFIAALVVVINFVVDLTYAFLDPRLSLWK